ncbi:hypothetical protein [Chondromyces crocatus]|uniref:Uncharacterized protein n=1 Tax=Chondromyces crocatus TaxID=52 RepID=A0A0K1E8V2_CHOCO|nr:hypothetical protein [Chondromyces crocatus]AKT37295.1 uncharacterized protein CMC5_014260 [Chondromyces crocatus]
MISKSLSAVALAVCLVACNSGEKSPDAASGAATSAGAVKPAAEGKKAEEGKAAEGKAAEGKGETILGGGKATKLPKLNLQIDLPEDSAVTDAIIGEGHTVMGASAPLNVAPAGENKPKTLEAAQKEFEDFKPQNIKTETLPDGWVLTFENEGSMGKNYWAMVRRELGGKSYICDTSVGHEKQRDAVVAACKSLRP